MSQDPTAAAAPLAPSGVALTKATLVAVIAGAIVLVSAVLPAEYGIDPLGTGRALGLMALYEADQEAATAAAWPAAFAPPDGGPVFPQNNEYRFDTREFKVAPKTGMEFKYDLDKGATMLYSWKATGFVNFDFHTEPAGKPPEASDSFEKGEAVQKKGAYTAPYDGIHGWYWENSTDREVTVTLTTAGFYEEARLFLPKEPPQTIEIPERP